MPTSERDLYLAAHDLHRAYGALDALKLTPEQPQGERVMRPAPGPRCPAPIILISLDADLTTRLQEIVYNASQDLGIPVVAGRNGRILSQWLKDHATQVITLPWVDDIHDELTTQEARISSYTNRADVDELRYQPEPYQLGEVIIQRLASRGVTVTREQLRQWASRGHITSKIGTDGRARYLGSEILGRMSQLPD